MSRTILLTVLTLICVSMIGAAGSNAADPAFRAGAAIGDITPQKWPVDLVGNFFPRPATKAWDPLNARALVLDDSVTKIAFVIVDSCYCSRSLFDDAKERASRLTGIPTDHMLMAATHTHSAPRAKDRHDWKADPEYVEHVTRGIVSALQQASENLLPAEIGFGVAMLPEEVFNRRWFMKTATATMPPTPFGETTDQVRMNPPRGRKVLDRPAGPTDPEICFVSVKTPDGRPLALLANYSLHYVGGVPGGGVSSDYFGEFAKQIEMRLFPVQTDGKESNADDGQREEPLRDTLPPFVGILSNGTSGDINNINFLDPRPRAKPFERIRAVASRVADRVSEALAEVEYKKWVPLGMAQSEMTVKVRRPTNFQLAQSRKLIVEEDDSKLPNRFSRVFAGWAIGLHEHPGTEDIIVQAIRIGDVGVTSIPCETFVEIGLRLKQDSPFKNTFTIELANGHYGYLPTPDQHRLGGYETWLGSGSLEEEASPKIEEELLRMLRTMK
jgi:neutral ceramidase